MSSVVSSEPAFSLTGPEPPSTLSSVMRLADACAPVRPACCQNWLMTAGFSLASVTIPILRPLPFPLTPDRLYRVAKSLGNRAVFGPDFGCAAAGTGAMLLCCVG